MAEGVKEEENKSNMTWIEDENKINMTWIRDKSPTRPPAD